MYLVQTGVEDRSVGLSNLHTAAFEGAQTPPLAGCGCHRWVVLLPFTTAVPIWEAAIHQKETLHKLIKTNGIWGHLIK